MSNRIDPNFSKVLSEENGAVSNRDKNSTSERNPNKDLKIIIQNNSSIKKIKPPMNQLYKEFDNPAVIGSFNI